MKDIRHSRASISDKDPILNRLQNYISKSIYDISSIILKRTKKDFSDGIPEKITLNDDDILLGEDSENGYTKFYVKRSNLIYLSGDSSQALRGDGSFEDVSTPTTVPSTILAFDNTNGIIYKMASDYSWSSHGTISGVSNYDLITTHSVTYNTYYASFRNKGGAFDSKMYRSLDGGVTWVDITSDFIGAEYNQQTYINQISSAGKDYIVASVFCSQGGYGSYVRLLSGGSWSTIYKSADHGYPIYGCAAFGINNIYFFLDHANTGYLYKYTGSVSLVHSWSLAPGYNERYYCLFLAENNIWIASQEKIMYFWNGSAISSESSAFYGLGNPYNVLALNPFDYIDSNNVFFADVDISAYRYVTRKKSGTSWNVYRDHTGEGDLTYDEDYFVIIGLTSTSIIALNLGSSTPANQEAMVFNGVLWEDKSSELPSVTLQTAVLKTASQTSISHDDLLDDGVYSHSEIDDYIDTIISDVDDHIANTTDPHGATGTPSANVIPKSDSGSKLDSWISSAAAAVKGILKLAGDLSGTSDLPTVAGLGGDSLPSNQSNGFLKRNSANDAWEEVPYGTGSNNPCVGDDSRLSDDRTPIAHDLAGSKHSSDSLSDLNSLISDYNIGDPVIAQASTPLSLSSSDSGKFYTNEGASAQIVFNLPTAVSGLSYTFFVQDSDGLQVVAATGDTIRIAGSATPTAGNISSSNIGDSVKILAINDTEWIAVFYIGTWSVST